MEHNEIDQAVIALFKSAEEMYGEAMERFWFYEDEICPCCKKRSIDSIKMGKDLALSLNAFMYRDLNTLIAYFLCSYCVTDLLRADKAQKKKYHTLEENLKSAYHDYLKSEAS